MATIEAVVHIGERLRRLREERALRQEDLSKLAGIGKNTVNRIEKNRTEPHMTTIRKLADALEVDPAKLVRGESFSPRVTKSGERSPQQGHHPGDLALLDSLVQDSTLAAAISSASPRASTHWQDGLDRVPLLEPGPGSENPL